MFLFCLSIDYIEFIEKTSFDLDIFIYFFCSEINIRFLFNYDLILIQFFFLIKIPEIQYGKVKYTFILIFIETDENSSIKIFVEFIGNY